MNMHMHRSPGGRTPGWLPVVLTIVIGLTFAGCGAEESAARSNPAARPPTAAKASEPVPPPAKLVVPLAQDFITGEALLRALRGGGYVIFFRHFQTDHTKWHEDPIKPLHGKMTVADFKSTGDQQRHLTDYGRKRARDVGAMMRQLQIPIGKVQSSPYIRVMDSARLLAGREPDETPYELVYRGGDLTNEIMCRNLLPYLGTKPAPGTNTLVVAHRTQMDDIRFITEGEAFVFEPLGDGKFNLIATIYDSDWFEAQYDVAYLGLRGRQPGGDTPPAK
jgi:phosphohistidine phosphatase SixA